MLGGFWQFLFFDSVKTYSNSICDYFAVDRDGDGNCDGDGNSDVAAYASSAAGAFYINLLLKKINTNAKAAKAASKAEGK